MHTPAALKSKGKCFVWSARQKGQRWSTNRTLAIGRWEPWIYAQVLHEHLGSNSYPGWEWGCNHMAEVQKHVCIKMAEVRPSSTKQRLVAMEAMPSPVWKDRTWGWICSSVCPTSETVDPRSILVQSSVPHTEFYIFVKEKWLAVRLTSPGLPFHLFTNLSRTELWGLRNPTKYLNV